MEDIRAFPNPQQRFRIDSEALMTAIRRQILIVAYHLHIADIFHCKFSCMLDGEAPVKYC